MEQAAHRLAGRVLVVEDHPVNQQVIAFQLEEMGLDYDLADDGQAALERLADTRYDLVLMDWQMPGMDGDEATRRIRQNPALSGLPVVAITANAGKEFCEACRAAGADAYLGKPYDESELGDLLARWLEPGTQGETRIPSPVVEDKTAASTGSLVDRTALIARYPGNAALIDQLDEMFHSTSRECLALLGDAVPAREAERTVREAHKLRGGAASVLANTVRDAAGELEQAAKAGDWSRAEASLAELQRLFA